MRRPIQITVLALATAVAALVTSASAAAKEPCWQTLINDWYDGRIDNVYPVACYRKALEHQPEDVAQYSSLGDDINRALQAAIAGKGSGGGSNGSGSGGSTFFGGPRSELGVAGVTAGGRDGGGSPVEQALGSLGADSADSVPVPLIVLGALAILLLGLGAAGFAARRIQTRRTAARASVKG